MSLWLTGEAAWFGVPGRAEAFALPLAHAAGRPAGRGAGRRTGDGLLAVRGPAALTEADLLPGVRIAGAAVFAEEVLADGVQALVY